MKHTEIIKYLRSKVDQNLKEQGYKYASKNMAYVKFDNETKLFFSIELVFLDYATEKDDKAKYLEIYTNIYHETFSSILHRTSTRKEFTNPFSFKMLGNILSDIFLNPKIDEYTKKNNHNYFKLVFDDVSEFETCTDKFLKILSDYALPFFDAYRGVKMIKEAIDRSYDKCLAIHNINYERLLVLTILLFYYHDSQLEDKLEEIRRYFVSINNPSALEDLNQLISYLSTNKLSIDITSYP
jgi:hypothetical protein